MHRWWLLWQRTKVFLRCDLRLQWLPNRNCELHERWLSAACIRMWLFISMNGSRGCRSRIRFRLPEYRSPHSLMSHQACYTYGKRLIALRAIRTLSSMYLSFIIFRIHKFPYDRIRIAMQFILMIAATVCKIRFIFFVCFGESIQFELVRTRARFVNFTIDRFHSTPSVCSCPWMLDVTVYSLSVFTFDYIITITNCIHRSGNPNGW